MPTPSRPKRALPRSCWLPWPAEPVRPAREVLYTLRGSSIMPLGSMIFILQRLRSLQVEPGGCAINVSTSRYAPVWVWCRSRSTTGNLELPMRGQFQVKGLNTLLFYLGSEYRSQGIADKERGNFWGNSGLVMSPKRMML